MKKVLLILGLVVGFEGIAQIEGIAGIYNTESSIVVNQIEHKDSTHHHPTFKSELKDYWKRANTPGTSDYHILWGGLGFGLGYWLVDWINSDHSNGSGVAIYNGQCSAIAASTSQRCKRQASPGTAYCWQHQ